MNVDSNKLIVSFQSGSKIYLGNKLLDHRKFSREGVFVAFNFFTKKEITKKSTIILKSSCSISNAIAKEIDINVPEIDVDFVTKIPNILACNINYSIVVTKKINNFLDHGFSLKFRLFPLFYKKGQIISNQLHSLGGLISSEDDGSLPDLEKATQISYSINYWFSNLTSISMLIFANSDWSINNSANYSLYPGAAVKFEILLSQNLQPPWVRRFNK